MLANVWLKLHGAGIVEWPETTIGSESTARADYLAAIRAADRHDYGPLTELHRAFTPARSQP
jgi:hypothetical protein